MKNGKWFWLAIAAMTLTTAGAYADTATTPSNVSKTAASPPVQVPAVKPAKHHLHHHQGAGKHHKKPAEKTKDIKKTT